MMDYWFFFSYAHVDDGNFLRKFYQDLSDEVRGLVGIPKQQVSFLDRNSIGHGSTWDTALEDGLKTCRVFVPLYSASYFQSEYCGKEFAAFRQRLHNHLIGQGNPVDDSLIMPVLWNPEDQVLSLIPTTINKIQYTDDNLQTGYPAQYKSEGVWQLTRLGIGLTAKYYNEYWDFIRSFARNVKAAATRLQLTPSNSLTPLGAVNSIFSTATVPTPATAEGPRYIQFIFVAGKKPELQAAFRQNLQFYGQNGGSDWQPYLDDYKGNALALAAEVIAELPPGSQYEEVTNFSDIEDHVTRAEQQDRIVVVMVDTWTLRLQQYQQLIAPLNRLASVNCITLIAWNDSDREASLNKGILEAAVNGVFTNKVLRNTGDFISSSVKSYTTFKQELVKALTQAQSQVAATAQFKKDMQFAVVASDPSPFS
jgi:FxsC-like protein